MPTMNWYYRPTLDTPAAGAQTTCLGRSTAQRVTRRLASVSGRVKVGRDRGRAWLDFQSRRVTMHSRLLCILRGGRRVVPRAPLCLSLCQAPRRSPYGIGAALTLSLTNCQPERHGGTPHGKQRAQKRPQPKRGRSWVGMVLSDTRQRYPRGRGSLRRKRHLRGDHQL